MIASGLKKNIGHPFCAIRYVHPWKFNRKVYASYFYETLLKQVLHFGHQTRRWNPKMIHLHRQRHSRVDLQRPFTRLKRHICLSSGCTDGGNVLCRYQKQARIQLLKRHSVAVCTTLPTVGWVALTNFATIRKRIARLILQKMEEDGSFSMRTRSRESST